MGNKAKKKRSLLNKKLKEQGKVKLDNSRFLKLVGYIGRKLTKEEKKKQNDDWWKQYHEDLMRGVGDPLPDRPESIKGIGAKKSIFDSKWKRPYTGEMEERENKAIEEAERKAKQVAPIYNKGAYQYISNRENAKDIGK